MPQASNIKSFLAARRGATMRRNYPGAVDARPMTIMRLSVEESSAARAAFDDVLNFALVVQRPSSIVWPERRRTRLNCPDRPDELL